ncbi:MAG: DoxX family membrane protein [Thermoleophilaceae bacterium]
MDLGLLLLRLVCGGLFVWYGVERLRGRAPRQSSLVNASHAAPVRAGWPTTLVAVLELGGGLLLLLGLVTSVAALLVSAAVLIGVLLASARPEPRADELTLLLLAVPFALAAVGPGSWSLDDVIAYDWIGAGWALLELGVAWVVATAAAVTAGREGPATAAPAGVRPWQGRSSR